MKTIGIPEDLHKELTNLKLESGDKNTAELIRKLVIIYKEKKFLENSHKFNNLLKQRNISFKEFLKESRKEREKISDEWFA